jgi:putative MFS transporter
VAAAGRSVEPGPRPGDEVIARLERIPISRFHTRLTALLGFGTFFDSYDSLAIGVALSVVFQTLHISLVNTGILISIAYLGQFVGAILFGVLSERIGRKKAFLASIAIFGLCSLGAALAHSYESLFWFRLVEGIGLGGEVPVAASLLNEYVLGAHRGKLVAIYETLFSWGLFLTPLVGYVLMGTLGPELGWRLLFAIGLLPALWAIVGWWLLPESARWLVDKGRIGEAGAIVGRIEAELQRRGVELPAPGVRVQADIKPTRFAELFSHDYRRRTLLTWIQWFMCYFITYGYITWLPGLYVRVGHLPPQMGLLLTALSSACSVAVGYSMAAVLDSIGRKAVFTFLFGVAAAGALLGVVLISQHVTGWPALFAVAVVMLIGSGGNSLGVYVYTPELYPTRMRAWGTAAASSMNRIASFIAPILVGVLLGAGLGIQSVFGMFAVAALIGMVGMMTLGIETKQKTLEELSQ